MNIRKDNSLLEQMLMLLSRQDGDSLKENGLYDTARQVKDFIDKLPGGFLIYKADDSEEILYANKALLRIFRCATFEEFKELTGNSFKGVVFHEDLDKAEVSIKNQIEHNLDDLDYVEYRIMCKDGVIRWVEDFGHYVHTNAMGDIFYVFITDSTEQINRRNTERAALINESQEKEKTIKNLIEEYDKERKIISQEYLRRLEVIEGLSVNYESILYVDLDADKVLPYRLSSRLVRQFENKLQPRDYLWFADDYVKVWVHPDDREKVARMLSPEYMRKKLTDNATYYFNFRCIQNGETLYLQLRLADVNNSGHISQVVMGYRNIDEEILQEMNQKKLLQDALSNAKIASIAKNTFLSNMSHDMRTPLNEIFGFTALAHKNLGDSEIVKSYLDKIDTAGKQILELIDKVLEISYLESQEFHITEKECNVYDIAKEIYDTLSPQAEKKKIALTLDFENLEHTDVYADKDKLKQILMHVASNAVKFTDNGGKIRLILAEQKSTSDEYATFRFIMKDTGVGISGDYLHHIFEPFEREKDSTHSGMFGSGLGLTIAKHIIEMMGGTIEAESAVGKGSTFTITLSFRLQNSQSPDDDTEDISAELKNKKILIVEDNEINLEIETEMLEDFGCIVDAAENGKIAVEKVKASKPGEYLFVLMDIQMPVMDGRKAAEEIRKLDNPALANIPIIALSANAFESDKRMSIETGMDAHLTKPIDIPLLMKTIAKTLRSR